MFDHRKITLEALRDLEVDLSPAAKKANRDLFYKVISHRPDLVARVMEDILAGNYGLGAQLLMEDKVRRRWKLGHLQVGAILILIGGIEWMVPRSLAAHITEGLTLVEIDDLNDAVRTAIRQSELHGYSASDYPDS